MKLTLPLLTSAALLFGATTLHAVEDPGASEHAPGHQMQQDDIPGAPGASEHAPGQKAEPGATAGKTMDSDPSPQAPGASDYAPGKQENPAATGGKTKEGGGAPTKR
jgi:hypothetical protein